MIIAKNMADVAKLPKELRQAVTNILDEQGYLSWAEGRQGSADEFQQFMGGDFAILEPKDDVDMVHVFGPGNLPTNLLEATQRADSIKCCGGFVEIFWTTNNSGGPTVIVPLEEWVDGRLRGMIDSLAGPQLCPACRHDRFQIAFLQLLNVPGARVFKPGKMEHNGASFEQLFDEYDLSFDVGYTCERCGAQTVMVNGAMLRDCGQDVDAVAEMVAAMVADKCSCPSGLARAVTARAMGLVTVAAATKAAIKLWDPEKWERHEAQAAAQLPKLEKEPAPEVREKIDKKIAKAKKRRKKTDE